MERIDSHMHAFPAGQVGRRHELAADEPAFAEIYAAGSARMATGPQAIARLRADGFHAGVLTGFAFGCQAHIDELNEHLLDCRATAPDSVSVLAAINPGERGWRQTFRRGLDGGACGFGELRPGSQAWDPLGAAAREFYAAASEARSIVLWHVSEPVGHSYPGKSGGIAPWQLWQVAVEFPELRQVAAHLGGGLPFYLQMPEVRAALGNVWFDTAAATLLYDDASVRRVVELAGVGRVLFGSDYPLLSPRRQLERTLAVVPVQIADAVCGGNALDLFCGSAPG